LAGACFLVDDSGVVDLSLKEADLAGLRAEDLSSLGLVPLSWAAGLFFGAGLEAPWAWEEFFLALVLVLVRV
jgi:hypothetical protein